MTNSIKRFTKKNKVHLKESVGRDLVGASSFSNRSTVAKQIVAKYPTPDKLAKGLLELAAATKDSKAKAKIQELAVKCKSLDTMSYPAFVEKIAGFNKLWTIVGGTVAATALTASAYWLGSRFCQAYKANKDALQKGTAGVNQKYDPEIDELSNFAAENGGTEEGLQAYSAAANKLDAKNAELAKLKDQFGLGKTLRDTKGLLKGDLKSVRDFGSKVIHKSPVDLYNAGANRIKAWQAKRAAEKAGLESWKQQQLDNYLKGPMGMYDTNEYPGAPLRSTPFA